VKQPRGSCHLNTPLTVTTIHSAGLITTELSPQLSVFTIVKK